jgi:hypothetical protein
MSPSRYRLVMAHHLAATPRAVREKVTARPVTGRGRGGEIAKARRRQHGKAEKDTVPGRTVRLLREIPRGVDVGDQADDPCEYEADRETDCQRSRHGLDGDAALAQQSHQPADDVDRGRPR